MFINNCYLFKKEIINKKRNMQGLIEDFQHSDLALYALNHAEFLRIRFMNTVYNGHRK